MTSLKLPRAPEISLAQESDAASEALESLRRIAPESDPEPDVKAVKKAEKAEKDARRQLNSWERYKALSDSVEMSQDLIDLADHKARFALVAMGALNAGLYIVESRTDIFAELGPAHRHHVMLGVAAYALVVLYAFVQVLEALRPRELFPRQASGRPLPATRGLRFFADVRQHDADSYHDAWQDVPIDQLNSELALQAYALARINIAKFTALRRLYRGLQAMVGMAALMLLTVAGWSALKILAPAGGGAPASLLGQPQVVTGFGVKEPSGIAADAVRQRLWVVGDEGTLAELDADGRPLQGHAVGGNLEDVAVHPSGRLVLLSEKQSQLLLYDPQLRAVVRRWQLDRHALLGTAAGDANHGFEGLGFRAEEGRPGGGVFYLVHQRQPAMVIALAFDVEAPDGPLGPQVLGRFALPGGAARAVTYAPTLDRLLVLSSKRGVLVMRQDGQVESETRLPGEQQEGLAMDAAGTLWVTDDAQRALLRFPGALDLLGARRTP